MERLIRWHESMNRSADLSMVAIVSEDEWKLFKRAIIEGKSIYLGEVSGKHSEVSVVIEGSNIEVITDVDSEIALVRKLFPTGFVSGIDIIDRISQEYDGSRE